MTPYLAIVKDSFREALASRVLWVLMLLITVVLLALVPFHWQTTPASKLSSGDFFDIRLLANELKAGSRKDASPLSRHVWDALSERTKERVNELESSHGQQARRTRERVAADFNRIIERDDFFDAELWKDTKLDERAEALLARDRLKPELQQQLNRLALEAALPFQLPSCPEDAVLFRYAKWDLDFTGPISRPIAQTTIDTFVMAFMSVFVGFFGIFSGVIVTAPVIPNMFDSGSLYVLLSKPISRPLLFVAKFFGGCSFVLINAAYLILGLWAIASWRFDLTKPQILWSIPIFVFSFAIFYAVSAVAGLIWRSTVMAIVATILFWFLCTTVSSVKDIMEQLFISPQRISAVLRNDNELFAVRRNGAVTHWEPNSEKLEEILKRENEQQGPPMMRGRNSVEGMVYDADNEQLIVLDREWPQQNIVAGRKSEAWRRTVIGPAPQGTRAIFSHKGAAIAVADRGVFQLATVPSDEAKLPEINLFGFKIPTPAPKELHSSISEGIDKPLPGNVHIAYDPVSNDLYVYGAGELRRWSVGDEERFHEVDRAELALENVSGFVAANQQLVFATHTKSTKLLFYDGRSLELQKEQDLETDAELRDVKLSGDGQWVAVLHDNDRLSLLGVKDGRVLRRVPRQGNLTDVAFHADNLVVCDVNDQVAVLSVPDFEPQLTFQPDQALIAKLHRYLIKPLHFVFPKPAELQHTMRYAITGKDTMRIEGGPGGGNGPIVKLTPWQPLVSNSAFIGVMLLLGCLYMYRQDF